MNILFLVCNKNLMWPKIDGEIRHPVEIYRKKIFYKRIEVYTTIAAAGYQETCIKWLTTLNKWDAEKALDYYQKLNIKHFNLGHKFEGSNKLDFESTKTKLEKLVGGLPKPVTTVVSTNYAHNLSAPLSRLAFEQSKTQYPIKIVVNMDYHFDCGYGTKTEVGVDNGGWGKHTVLNIIPGAVAQVYATFGVRDVPPGGLFAGGKGLVFKGGGVGGIGTDKILSDIDNIVKDYKSKGFQGVDMYVTVDRDVLTYGKTDFKPGKAERGILITTLEPMIARLNKYGHVNIVGFDITGLPYAGGDLDERSTITDKAACDINDWCGVVQSHMM